jgi:DNA-binding transcriptional regulator LsrR (DeoR family)
LTIHDKELYYTVIQYYINGLPRSEISAKTGISTGSVSNYIKKWVESVEIQDIEGIRDLMKQVNKTGATVKECAQGHIILQLIKSVYNDEEEDEV